MVGGHLGEGGWFQCVSGHAQRRNKKKEIRFKDLCLPPPPPPPPRILLSLLSSDGGRVKLGDKGWEEGHFYPLWTPRGHTHKVPLSVMAHPILPLGRLRCSSLTSMCV